jgi:hypothetical protein
LICPSYLPICAFQIVAQNASQLPTPIAADHKKRLSKCR